MFSSINSLFYATRVAHANYLIEQLLVVLGIVLVLLQLLDQSLLPLLALLQRVPVLYVLPHVGFRLEQLLGEEQFLYLHSMQHRKQTGISRFADWSGSTSV